METQPPVEQTPPQATPNPTAEPVEPASPPEEPEQQLVEEDESADKFWEILDALIPDGVITISDANGNEYPVQTSLPFKKQVRVLRIIQELVEAKQGDASFQAAWGAVTSGDMSTGLALGLDIISDDYVIERLDRIFEIAFPSVLAQARLNDGETSGNLGATDLFPLEELIGATAPFLARMVRSVLQKTAVPTEK